MKKTRRTIILMLLILLIILVPKSRIEMLSNAKHEFRKVFIRIGAQFEPADFHGPIIQKSSRYKNEFVYKWYKVLPFKDTAWISVYIPRLRFKSPDITMSNGVHYLFRKTNNLYEIFPSCEDSSILPPSTTNTLFSQEKLITILQEGFYDVASVNEELTFLVFWEPFAIYCTGDAEVKTRYALFSLNDECQLTLKPFLLPDSIEDYLVLKEDGYHYMPELRNRE